ncbi:MAG: general secretion pathway protein GspB [Arenicellales bacterium]
MSYILEALKKSERERQRGNIASLHTPSQVVLNRRSLWMGMLIGAMALTALAGAGWVVHRQLMRSSPGEPVVSPVPSPLPEPKGSSRGVSRESSRSPAAPAAAADSPDAATVEPVSLQETSKAVRDVNSIEELDPADRALIRRLSLNVVSYSEVPARRFVMINQRIAHEDESVGDGVVVERIVPGGALLRVGGYRIMIRPD